MSGVGKRKRGDELAMVASGAKKQRALDSKSLVTRAAALERTSSLAAPIMKLTGHSEAVHAVAFSDDGRTLCSAGADRQLLFWNSYGDCVNFAAFGAHRKAIVDVCFAVGGEQVLTASADKTVGLWDVSVGERLRKWPHKRVVNACAASRRGDGFVSVSDDGFACLWDARQRTPALTWEAAPAVHPDGSVSQLPLTACAFAGDSMSVFVGAIDANIYQWDARQTGDVICTMGTPSVPGGASMIVGGLALAPNGNTLAASWTDGVRLYDVRPFAPAQRCTRQLALPQSVVSGNAVDRNLNRCTFDASGDRVCAGASDGCVYIWDWMTSKLLYRLPGHTGAVLGVAWHPLEREPIVASAGIDGSVFLGEVEGTDD